MVEASSDSHVNESKLTEKSLYKFSYFLHLLYNFLLFVMKFLLYFCVNVFFTYMKKRLYCMSQIRKDFSFIIIIVILCTVLETEQ